MTCATCRFFGARAPLAHFSGFPDDRPDDFLGRESEHHYCARIIHGNAGGLGPTVLQEPAVVTDGSGYAARLRVLPSFGCVLHEERTR